MKDDAAAGAGGGERQLLQTESGAQPHDSARNRSRTTPRAACAALRRIGCGSSWSASLPLGAWMAFAPLSMAVVAPGFVKVDLNRRPVQHLEGGIVREVLVRDGQSVKAGEPILMLGDVSVDADRNRLAYRVRVERAALARLEAEQARRDSLVFPDGPAGRCAAGRARAAGAGQGNGAVRGAPQFARAAKSALMRAQRERVQQEIVALRGADRAGAELARAAARRSRDQPRPGRRAASSPPPASARSRPRWSTTPAKLEERRSELARAGQRLVDSDLKIQSIQNDYVQTASDQLKAAAARVGEIEQELRKSEDAAARQVVVAPAGGEVIDLKFTSPGAVVRPGDPIAEIVPERQPADDRGAHPPGGDQPRAARAARAHQVHRLQVPQHLDGDRQGHLRLGRPPDRQGRATCRTTA